MSTNPYESPPPLDVAVRAPSGYAQIVPFESGRIRAWCAIATLSLTVVLCLGTFVSNFIQLKLLQAANLGQDSQAALESSDSRQRLLAGASIVLAIATPVSFLMWFHRAYRNLPALGADGLGYTPRWAVGYWFIPVLNLGRPCQVACELWRASDPRIEESWGTAWQRARLTPLIGFWWAAWLIATFANRFVSRMSTESIDDWIHFSRAAIAADVPRVVAAVLAIMLVAAIDRRQEAKYEQRFRQGQSLAVETMPG